MSVHKILRRCNHLNKSDVVTFEQNSANLLSFSLLMDLFSFIDNKIHIFIEANDVSFNTCLNIFVQPNLYSSSSLQTSKDEINWLNHNFLNFWWHD